MTTMPLWILRVRKILRRQKRPNKEYEELREAARSIAKERVAYFAELYRLAEVDRAPKKIFIKDTKSRWGSCSEKGNLNFNYRIAKLPPHLSDYVIVHEVCHLLEFNHSIRFWRLVAAMIPDYRACRQALKNYPFKRTHAPRRPLRS